MWSSLPERVTLPEIPLWHLEELARRRAAAEADPGMGKRCREVLGPLKA
jgi:hypothetical protein